MIPAAVYHFSADSIPGYINISHEHDFKQVDFIHVILTSLIQLNSTITEDSLIMGLEAPDNS
jgi:hypothetical protein